LFACSQSSAEPRIEFALAAAHAAEIEPQHGKTALHEQVKQLNGHRIVHVAAGLRMGVQDQRDRRILPLALRIAAFDTAGCARQDNLRHRTSLCSHHHAARPADVPNT
jgi:hypothetical protein